MEQVNTYRVRPGFRHGAQKQYGPGDLVELTAAQAAAFDDKLELVGPAAFNFATNAPEEPAVAVQDDPVASVLTTT